MIHLMSQMTALNVSDDLANYLTMALDLTVKEMAEFMTGQLKDGEYQRRIDKLEAERLDLMKSFDSPVDVFRSLAVT